MLYALIIYVTGSNGRVSRGSGEMEEYDKGFYKYSYFSKNCDASYLSNAVNSSRVEVTPASTIYWVITGPSHKKR